MKKFAVFCWVWIRETPGSTVRFFTEYKYDPDEHKNSDAFRGFAKGFLELIRNIAVVSAIKFFATRSNSASLSFVAELGQFAVAVTLATYLTRISFRGWDDIESVWLRRTLGVLYSVFPGIIVYYVLGRMIDYIVAEIVRSQLIY